MILRRRLHLHHWQGLMLIAVGAFVVGLSSVLHNAHPGPAPPARRHHRHRHTPFPEYDDYSDYDPTVSSDYVRSSAPRALHMAAGAGVPPLQQSLQQGRAHVHQAAPDARASSHSASTARSVPSKQLPPSKGRLAGGWEPSDTGKYSAAVQASNPLLGNLFVLAAQVFSALQFVVEEKYVKQYRMPALLAVGLEGFWGLILSCAYLPLFLHLRVCTPSHRPMSGGSWRLLRGVRCSVWHRGQALTGLVCCFDGATQCSFAATLARQLHSKRCYEHTCSSRPRTQGPDGWPVDDAVRAVAQIRRSRALQAAVGGAVLSMAWYNYFGVRITKRLSGTARLSIDACRTAVVWVLSLLAGWERFVGMQLLGYLILVCGTTLYNELLSVVVAPAGRCGCSLGREVLLLCFNKRG